MPCHVTCVTVPAVLSTVGNRLRSDELGATGFDKAFFVDIATCDSFYFQFWISECRRQYGYMWTWQNDEPEVFKTKCGSKGRIKRDARGASIQQEASTMTQQETSASQHERSSTSQGEATTMAQQESSMLQHEESSMPQREASTMAQKEASTMARKEKSPSMKKETVSGIQGRMESLQQQPQPGGGVDDIRGNGIGKCSS